MENKKNILIVGASSEIAQAIIKALSNTSYTLLTTSRNGDDATFALDVTKQDSISAFQTEIINTKFHFVIYCAGFINAQESSESFMSAYGKKSELVNFKAVTQLFDTLKPTIGDGGGMMALSSTAGIWGNPQFPIYASWKGALNTYLQSVHKLVSERNMYIFSICPGPTNTQMRQSLVGDANEHQSPSIVAEHIANIIQNPKNYKDSPTLVIRNSALYTLEQELTLCK